MKLLTLYGALLALASLISERTRRTVLSTSVLFLVAGGIAGAAGVGLVHLDAGDPAVGDSARMALFVLLVDKQAAHPASPASKGGAP